MNRRQYIFSVFVVIALFLSSLPVAGAGGLPAWSDESLQMSATRAGDSRPPALDGASLPRPAGPYINGTPAGPVVVRIYIDDKAHLALIANALDIWETHPEAMYVVAAVAPDQYQWLASLGYRMEIDAEKTERLNRPFQPLPGQTEGIPGYPCYRTVEETFASAQAMVAAYPSLAQWTDIGDSWEKSMPGGLPGYDIYVLKLTNANVPGPKPKLFVMAAIHAREYTTAELNTRFAEYLVSRYGTDPDVTGLLDFYEVHLVLQTNPDGRKLAEAGALWRKNTNTTCPSYPSYRGVDLNRNFPFQWGCCGGSSGNGCDETYRGTGAASEPETQAVVNYVLSQFPDQRAPALTAPAPLTATGVFLDLHSYGGDVMWSWGFTPNAPPNSTQLQTLGRKMAYFNGYSPYQSYQMYPTDGTTKDFAYGELGLAGYTIELGTAFFQDCATFENTILPDNLPVLLYAAKAARRPYQSPAGPDALNVTVTPTSTMATGQVTLTAVANDTRYNNSMGTEPTQNIAAARYTVDKPAWHTGVVSYPLAAADGSFNSPVENVIATVNTTGWTPGRHTLFVESQDANGNWGVPMAVFVWITAAPDSIVQGVVRSAPAGAPLAGATVSLMGDATTWQYITGQDGHYSFTVFSGTYTLAASAPAHYPAAPVQVTAPSGVTVTHDITLTAIPSGTLTGFIREEGTSFPLAATVQAVSGSYTYQTASDPATGLYALSLLSGTYTVTAQAAGHVSVIQKDVAIGGHQTTTLDLTLPVAACVLLVDDDGGRSYEGYFRSALDQAGVLYTGWSVAAQGNPAAATLAPYTAVVWFTGDDNTFTTLTDQDRANLTAYLQGGGNLFLTGTEIGVSNQNQPFYTGWLATQFITDDSGAKSLVGGGPFAGLALTLNGGDGANNQTWPDAIAPRGAAQGVFTYTNGLGGGVAVDAGTYRAINLGFGIEGIDNAAGRLAVVREGLKWLDCAPLLHAWTVDKTASAAMVQEGERISYTLTVTHVSFMTATNVVITDRLPLDTVFAGASAGGALEGDVATWTLPQVAPRQTFSLTLAVTATSAAAGKLLVNAAYGVRSDQTPAPAWGRPVTVTVLAIDKPAVLVSPPYLTATLAAGDETTRVLAVGNAGSLTLTWSLSVTPTVSWLVAAPAGGVVTPTGSAAVLITLTAPATAGVYTTALRIASNDPDTPLVSVPLTLTVLRPTPNIAVGPVEQSALLWPGGITTHTLTLSNTGDAALNWNVSETPPVDWLSASPVSGTVAPAGSVGVALRFDASGLSEGVYTTTLRIASNDPDMPLVSVPLTLTVLAGDAPVITVNPLYLGAALHVGQAVTRALTISNAGTAGLVWSLSIPGVSWLSAAPVSGTLTVGASQTVVVALSAPAVAGVYTTTLPIASNDPAWPEVNVAVTLNVAYAVYLPAILK